MMLAQMYKNAEFISKHKVKRTITLVCSRNKTDSKRRNGKEGRGLIFISYL